MAEHCIYCEKPVTGSYMSALEGRKAHTDCWYLVNPIKVRETFSDVLANCDDQVVVRQLLEVFVPKEVKSRIVSEFNLAMENRNQIRAQNGRER